MTPGTPQCWECLPPVNRQAAVHWLAVIAGRAARLAALVDEQTDESCPP